MNSQLLPPAADTRRRSPVHRRWLWLASAGVFAVAAWLLAPYARAWHHYRAAERCLERWDAVGARARLHDCLSAGGGGAAHLLAARAARLVGATDEAGVHLREALRLGAPVERVLIERYLLEVRRGNLEAAEPKLLAVLHRGHPDWPFILEVLTERWMLDRRLNVAAAHLDDWLRARPDDREALVRRAWVYEHAFDPGRAVDLYRRALELDPERDARDGDRVRRRVGELLLQTNRAAEAQAPFRLLAERHPQDRAVTLGLARCLRLTGDSGAAARALDAALAANPGDGLLLGEKGRIALEEGRVAEAEPLLREAARLCPHDRETAHGLYRCLSAIGLDAEARRALARLEKIRADEKRMRDLMAELSVRPADLALRIEIGTLFLRNGLAEDGVYWLGTVLQRDPTCKAARMALEEHFKAVANTLPTVSSTMDR